MKETFSEVTFESGIKNIFYFSKTNYDVNCQHFKKYYKISFNFTNFINFMNFTNFMNFMNFLD